MAIFDDLAAEQDRLEEILGGLSASQWASPSAAAGWSVTDVVLHLAQSEEGVVASATGRGRDLRPDRGRSVDEAMDDRVREERAAPEEVFRRWREARRAAVAALRAADPAVPLTWVEAPLKPATLATTRLAEHWAHGLDVTVPLGLELPDTDRLRHVAWLAHRTLPYALSVAGETPHPVYCELTAPDGTTVWRYGPPDADSAITGPVGAFCRVAAHRLDPAASGLQATGPHAATTLRHLRTYAA
jgi:uncharacterized protein (TIGR03084 family)